VRVLASQKGGSSGAANRSAGNGVLEIYALTRQSIEMRRLDVGFASEAYCLATELIGEYENDVGLFFLGIPLLHSDKPRNH
jgi:hypothetical protein